MGSKIGNWPMPNSTIPDGLGPGMDLLMMHRHWQSAMAAGPEDGKRWKLCEKIVQKLLFGWTSFNITKYKWMGTMKDGKK
jgi:hypothetical protein